MTRKTNTTPRRSRNHASRRRPSPALAISVLALFLALTGSAFAVGKNTVRSAQIVDGTIRAVDLGRDSVRSLKIADETVRAADLAANSVGQSEVAADAIGSEEIAENAVGSSEVAPDSLTAGDLGPASVGSSEVADQSLGADDLGPNSVGASEVAANAIGSSELAAVTVRSSSQPIEAGKTGGVSVACAAGEQVLSGGGQPAHFGVEMTSSRPSGNGWLYQAKNDNGSNSTITVYAVCLAP